MKKVVFLMAVFTFYVNTLKAQETETKLLRFGLQGNAGLCWMKTDQDSLQSLGLRLGYGYGFITEITLAKNFAVATGFDVIYQGGKIEKKGIKVAFPPDTVKELASRISTYRLQYLDIPLTLKMKTNEINYMTYFARIGGSFGLNLQAKADENYKNIPGTKEFTLEKVNIKEERKFFRVNFLIAAGVEYSLGGTTAALAEVSFTNGLTYLLDDKVKGNYLQLKLGILF
ncbi:MAG: PorT family protein [Bacteroidales bacterium]|nr:PorT family protein [Bacteroidales bacterium]